jgi:hypothetical protein
MNSAEIIETYFSGRDFKSGKKYHSELPDVLSPWYCYTIDAGHSILVLIEGHFSEADPELFNRLCPCPVKAVLRNYSMFNGYPAVSVKYDSMFGLQPESEDYEY